VAYTSSFPDIVSLPTVNRKKIDTRSNSFAVFIEYIPFNVSEASHTGYPIFLTRTPYYGFGAGEEVIDRFSYPGLISSFPAKGYIAVTTPRFPW
jgi:hypothetical protein